MFSKCQAVTICNYQLLSVQIQVSEEISHHSEGLGICNYSCVRICFHEVLDICGMIRLHMLYYQIIRFRTVQDFGYIFKPFVFEISIYGIHNCNLLIHDHI